MSPARIAFLKVLMHPPEMVVALTASELCSGRRDAGSCADVAPDRSGSGWQTAAAHQTSAYIYLKYLTNLLLETNLLATF